MTTFRTVDGGSLDRIAVIERLAAASHASWLRQKVRDQGSDPSTLSPDVTEHDIERAKDAVEALEAAGLLFAL
jgi:hypothetical protein